jgi:hypothetical protein
MTFKIKTEQIADNVPVTVVTMMPPFFMVNCSRGVKKAFDVDTEGDNDNDEGEIETLSLIVYDFDEICECLFVLSLNKHKVLVELGGHDAPKPFCFDIVYLWSLRVCVSYKKSEFEILCVCKKSCIFTILKLP